MSLHYLYTMLLHYTVSPPERNFMQIQWVRGVVVFSYLKVFFVCTKDVLFFLLQKEAKTGRLRFPPNPLKRFSCVVLFGVAILFGIASGEL